MAAKKNTSIALGEKHLAYVQRKVESGEFSSVSDVVRDALRRSEERDLKVERLRQLIREGEESGEPQSFDLDAFIEEMRAKHGNNLS